MTSNPTLAAGDRGSLDEPKSGERFMSGFILTPSLGGVDGLALLEPELEGESCLGLPDSWVGKTSGMSVVWTEVTPPWP